MSEDGWVILLLVSVNLVLGIGCAVPIARLLGRVHDRPGRFLRYFVMLIGLYFVEAVAFGAGMATMVFSMGLAFVWGVVFGLWLRRARAPVRRILKAAFAVSLYSALPTVSFLVLPVSMILTGGAVFSAQGGADFGIPESIPWPANTVMGFFGFLAVIALVFKPVITTGEVSLLLHLGERPAPQDAQAD